MDKNIVAKASFIHASPRKLRLVAKAVRDLEVIPAIDQLKLMPKRAARPILAVYQQALGNAKNNFQASPADLKVVSLQIHEGPRGARKADVHAHGARFNRGVRRKRMAHISLELAMGGKK
jgi:large subunit ribosomal protein L22